MDRENMPSINNIKINSHIFCEVYTSFEPLEGMRTEWDQFVMDVGRDIFLTFDWCAIWWKHYGNKRILKIIIFRSNKDIVGIMPLFLERIWLGPIFIDAVKIVGTDYTITQFTLPIRFEYLEQVISKLFQVLALEKWDVVYLGPLAGLYPHTDHLKKAVDRYWENNNKVFVKTKGEQIYFHLTDSWEKQLAKMNKSDRKDIGRSYRRLQKSFNDPTVRVETDVATQENFPQYFDDFVEMHQTYWHKLGKAGHFEDWPGALEFHREVAQKQLSRNRLKLLRIFIKNDDLGYEYEYWFGNKCFELLAGRSEEEKFTRVSVGKVNYSEKMQKLMENHIFIIDSMRGKYEYKLRLGGELYPIKSLYIVSKNKFEPFRILFFRILSRILNICYYKIWYSRIAARLPFKRRALWRLWIRSSFMRY